MKQPKFRFFVNRQIRRVPLTWKHPVDTYGYLIPLYEWEPTSRDGEETSNCMPDFSHVPEEAMGICAYETTSEGTPISPVFPDTPEGRFALTSYCAEHETIFANHQASPEAWAEILFGDALAVLDPVEKRIELKYPC